MTEFQWLAWAVIALFDVVAGLWLIAAAAGWRAALGIVLFSAGVGLSRLLNVALKRRK